MNSGADRICPFCAESIPARAKLCPRCRQWLTLRSFRHPLVQGVLLPVPLLVLLVALISAGIGRFERVFNPRPFYSELPDALQVLEARMNWVETDQGAMLYVTGLLTNRSEVAWRNIEFECRFFDGAGVMIDASHAPGRMTVLPRDDSAFRVAVRAGRPASDYRGLKVTVVTARNAGEGF